MIKVVLFDFGGVLTESGKSGFVRQALADVYGITIEDIDFKDLQYRWRKNMTDEKEVIAALNQQFDKQVTIEQFYDRLHSDTIRSGPVYALAGRLRQAGIKTGILSNVFATSASLLRAKGFYEGFDPIVLSCDEGYAKPDKELYEIAIERSAVAAEEILFIDDQEKCRLPAEMLGMHFILAVTPEQIVNDTVALLEQHNGLQLGKDVA